MPLPNQNTDRNNAISKLANETDLVDVAEWLNLRVVGRNTNAPKILCPFHDDRRPSMQLYSNNAFGKAQFHCFACGAHGDVFDLVKRQLNVDFSKALEWLAERCRVTIPKWATSGTGPRASSRSRGLELGYTIYQRQSKQETAALKEWSKKRVFDYPFIKRMEIYVTFTQKISGDTSGGQREQFDDLEAAGLVLRAPIARPGDTASLPLEMPPRDFYNTKRVIFTIRDDRGRINGFAGRAIGQELPKYLFTPGFPRGETLYRFNKVRADRPRKATKRQEKIVDLFVVEGLMDALRLESLGLPAVAILGSQISTKQIGLLTDFAKEAGRDGFDVAIHLFLDRDDAGRRGAVSATVKILNECIDIPGILLDVVTPFGSDLAGNDPDELLREISDKEIARSKLEQWCHSPMTLLLATALNVAPSSLDETWKALPDGERLQALRDVERRLDHSNWISLLDRVAVFETQLRKPSTEKREWQEMLSRFLKATRGPAARPPVPIILSEKDDDGRLIRALQIAEASTQRRELPIDEGSWDRLQAAVDVVVPYLQELLKKGASPSHKNDDPMLAVRVPKSDGAFRLKALPSPERLAIQQYVLNELLCGRTNCQRFRSLIPGVRFSTGSGRALETTGGEELVPLNGETVSFAYILDMDVIEHRAPPRRTGMFRAYHECWRDFISFIETRVSAFPKGTFHVARLDVRRFYNSVSRSLVNRVLLPSVRDALRELSETSEAGNALACAKLFRSDISDAEQRATTIVDWFCDQSFNYSFEQPGSICEDENPAGLPQGPDLSAYLANISLFPLDRALSELVAIFDRKASEEQGEVVQPGQSSSFRGAVYARYVDDMVIIARSGHDLTRLRSTVEQQLSNIGMELNPKTDPLPPMDEAGVREWLTDRRGAGLGISCLSEGPPTNTPLSLLEPLSESGETDRSDSLRILHDRRFDDPETTADEVEIAIEIALAAPDLRHGDKVAAARHLWRTIIQNAALDLNNVPHTAKAFKKLWISAKPKATSGRPVSGTHNDVTELLAWIDGIDRFLKLRTDRDPMFSEVKHDRIRNNRERMADLVHEGLCEELISHVIEAVEPSQFDRMFRLKVLSIRHLATIVKQPSKRFEIQGNGNISSQAEARLLISLADVQGTSDLLDVAYFRDETTPLIILFHESVARLKIANRQKAPLNVDPLFAVNDSIDKWRKMENQTSYLQTILDLWMPTDTSAPRHDEKITECAMTTLINVASSRAIELIDKRPRLKEYILNGDSNRIVELLPTPPGLNVPGLLGLLDEKTVVVRATFNPAKNDEIIFSPRLNWKDVNTKPRRLHFTRQEARLNEFKYLSPYVDGDSKSNLPKWLARAFRSLTKRTEGDEPDYNCMPTAINLLGPRPGTETDEDAWHALGYCVSSDKLSTQAYLSRDGGLVLEPVSGPHANLWRVGTALADWLGMGLSTRQLSSQRLAAPSLTDDGGNDWALNGMLRFTLCRLRGTSLPDRPLRLADSGLPLTVERILRRLEEFPKDPSFSNQRVGLAHLVATLVEGRAIYTRSELRIDPAIQGGSTALLLDMIRGQFREDEELSRRLPKQNLGLPVWAPTRRPARAFCALSERLGLLVDADPIKSEDNTLSALAAGTRLLCVESQLRSQALELWYLVDKKSQLQFEKFPPSLAEWNLDATALLHRDQPSPVKGAPIPEDWRNVRELFHKLARSTAENQRIDWVTLAGITPLGWLVVLGTLADMLAGDWRGGLVDAKLLDSDARGRFASFAAQLSIVGRDTYDPPWGGLEDVINAWNEDHFQQAMITLNSLDFAAGIEVTTHESTRFSIDSSRRSAREVNTSDGLRTVPSWIISSAHASNEKPNGIERVRSVTNDPRALFRWTESRCRDRLLSIGVVQPAMAALAGDSFADSVVPTDTKSTTAEAPETRNDDKPDTVTRTISVPDAGEPTADHSTSSVIPPAEDSKSNRASQLENTRNSNSDLDRLQKESWNSRREKPNSHIRVAYLQWDVDDTYRHPIFEICEDKKTGDDKKTSKWIEDDFRPSCAEFRRRALLKAALQACHGFNVEVLLLPEYSTRPETVDWLALNGPMLAPNTSIWAGTYRLPPGSMPRLGNIAPWSAVQEVVLSGERENKRRQRPKKYPSPAADEVFHPNESAMNPIFDIEGTGDALSFIYELICSEVFLVTSPANLLPLARVRRELLRKFRAGVGKTLDDDINVDITADIKRFAAATALSEGLGRTRRTIILVPAMTSRSADYSVLGQAGFLASGLTTVFCNAVCEHYGHGQSCFIGHDGWVDAPHKKGFPTIEPYHGARPGIFHLDHWNRGRLGKNEQAMVIADIDPVYGIEGKPRPQALLKPLKLVAHLPIIEAVRSLDNVSDCKCKRRRQHSFPWDGLQALHKALDRGITIKTWSTTMDDDEPQVLADSLEFLAQMVAAPGGKEKDKESGYGWMDQRKKAYLADHRADPLPWPPPVALDWLLVDLTINNAASIPKIEVPAYSFPPGGELR